MSQAPKFPILIIGGGLGGLSLAQGLAQGNIPFKVFERDDASSFRAQGYRIRLDERGIGSLKKLLPPDLFQLFEESCSPIQAGGHGYDAVTGEEEQRQMPTQGPVGQQQSGRILNADRTVLRNVLLRGLEAHVSFGKKFSHYTLCSDCITAHFTDKTSEPGSMLISADGIHSAVRHQLIPSQILLDSNVRAIFGKTPLHTIPPGTLDHIIDQGLTLTTSRSPEPHTVHFADTMHFRSTSPSLPLPEDYIYWVLCFPATHPSLPSNNFRELLSLSSTDSTSLANTLTSTWHDRHHALFTHQDPTATSTLAITMTKPDSLAVWPENNGRVTLLGDAAHPMPPLGGVGANSAFEDAAGLSQVLLEGRGEGWQQKLRLHEEEVVERARKALEASVGGMKRLFGMKDVGELKEEMVWRDVHSSTTYIN